MVRRNRVKVSQYAAALIVAPGGMKSTRRMSFLSQKTDAMIFFTEIEVLDFWFWGNAYGAIAMTDRSVVKNPCFISSHNGVQKLVSFLCVAHEKLQHGTNTFRFVIVR